MPKYSTNKIPSQRLSLFRLLYASFLDFLRLIGETWVELTGFALLAIGGMSYLRFTSHQTLTEALYETLKLLTLESDLELPHDIFGRILFFLMPLLGLALIFQGVLNFGRLLLDKGGRLEIWQLSLAATYRNHIILCGLGRVNWHVLKRLLAAGYEVVVVENDWEGEFVSRALKLNVPVVLGDAREERILRLAGITRARAICTAIDDDLLNIEIGITARAIRPEVRVIMRLFNESLDQSLERSFGVNTVFSATVLAAPTFAASSISQSMDYVVPLGDALLGILQLTLEPQTNLLAEKAKIEENYQIRILDHQTRSNGLRRASPGNLLKAGDHLTVIGELDALEEVRIENRKATSDNIQRSFQPQHLTEQFDTVIVCGLGKIGYRVVRQLYHLNPRPRIVVIRLNDNRDEFLLPISEYEGVQVVIGDARDPDVLKEAGIETAYSLAAITSDDAQNLQIGLMAQRLRPEINLVLRVFSDTLVDKFQELFGIRTTYSTSGLASPTLAAAAALGDVSYAFTVGQQIYSTDLYTVRADDPISGCTVAQIRDQHGLLIAGMRSRAPQQLGPTPIANYVDADDMLSELTYHPTEEDELLSKLSSTVEAVFLPSLEQQIRPGDQVVLLGSLPALERFRQA
jgi:Trk K+ transport system NAD-binding subunit